MQGIQDKIEELQGTLKEAPLNGTVNTELFFDLGWAYDQLYEDTHHMEHLESAIRYYKNGLEHEPVDEDYHGLLLNNISISVITRFEQLGETKDLEEAVTCQKQALALYPPGHPGRSQSLNNLGNVLKTRFGQLGEMEDLEQAIAYHEQALILHPPGHPSQFSSLNNLANALLDRYEQLGVIDDLEQAVNFHGQALGLCQIDDPDRSMCLNNLANSLNTRFDQLGEMKDLEQAIALFKKALPFYPVGHPTRPLSMMNLGNALLTRFEQLGVTSDLEEAVVCHKQALNLYPLGHTGNLLSLNNLANALFARFEQFGNMIDLEAVMTYCEQALVLSPLGHPGRSRSLNIFANALKTRFQLLGEMKDLEHAITYHEQALILCPPGHSDRVYSLNNLANAKITRFQKIGEIVDLEEATMCHEQALESYPSGHPNRSVSLNGLATAFSTKFEQLGEMKDLEKAITYYGQALVLSLPGHPGKFRSLYNLAGALMIKFEHTGNLSALESATANYKAALLALSPQHPFCCSVLSYQASLIMVLHESTWVSCHKCSHVEEACGLFMSAAHCVTSSLHDRFIAAKKWADAAHRHRHKSAISAYSTALDLQQQHLALLPSIVSQQKLMEGSAQLGLNAASCAISTGELEMAVQFLEQGRSILWSKIQGYRQSFEELSGMDLQLANEFRAVGHQLEHNAVSSDVNVALQRKLSEKWKTLLEKIRELDGHSDFLQAVPFNTLQHAAKEGPVIMVNISELQSDAIILVFHAPPVIVTLHDASPGKLKKLANQLLEITTSSMPSKGMAKILQYLWNTVVEPVVKQLTEMNIQERSHIWWCPTSYLCALPLHAAGPYRRGFKNLPDLYTCSYTPTLVSLNRARASTGKPQPAINILLVSQADNTIPCVFEETQVVNSFGKKVDTCSGKGAHKQAVLEGLQSHSWVHFACHGHLEEQPFNSWFQLHNRAHLTVLDLARAKLPNAEFAFLSACHSAAGDIHGTPDENIHLAAALQFCGFRSVIGTLWAMVDDDGPVIADAFYKHMFRNADTVDLRDVAEALNLATRELRKKNVPLDQWINFIHIGA